MEFFGFTLFQSNCTASLHLNYIVEAVVMLWRCSHPWGRRRLCKALAAITFVWVTTAALTQISCGVKMGMFSSENSFLSRGIWWVHRSSFAYEIQYKNEVTRCWLTVGPNLKHAQIQKRLSEVQNTSRSSGLRPDFLPLCFSILSHSQVEIVFITFAGE